MTLDAAYAACARLARTHYENFPVASHLLPRRMRPHVAAVYAFARLADDIADEGDVTLDLRNARLDEWLARLDAAIARGRAARIYRYSNRTWRRLPPPSSPRLARPCATARCRRRSSRTSSARFDRTRPSHGTPRGPTCSTTAGARPTLSGVSCCASGGGEIHSSTRHQTRCAPRCSSRTSGRTWRSTGRAVGCTSRRRSISAPGR